MTQAFVLGEGPYANELAEYLRIFLPQIPACRHDLTISMVGKKPGSCDMDRYVDLASGESRDTIFTYLGSGKIDIKRRMLAEVVGAIGTPVLLGLALKPSIGLGTVVAPGVVISIGCTIGTHVLINYSASIGHNASIGNLSVVGPHAAVGGGCRIGEAVYIGAGACIRENLTIGENAIVGMGAVVTRNVDSNTVVAGVPARVIQRRGGWSL